MKTLSIILIVLLSTGCMTVKRVKRNCDLFMTVCEVPVKVETEILTNTITEIEYRDTVIYIELPGREVIKEVPVYINKGIVDSKQSYLNVPFAESTAQVINSKLIHKLSQKDTVLRVELENALKLTKELKTENKILKEKSIVTIQVNKPFAKFTIKWFIGSVILIVAGLFILFLKYQAKITGFLK